MSDTQDDLTVAYAAGHHKAFSGMRAFVEKAVAALKWYVEHDDASPTDEYYLKGQRAAQALIDEYTDAAAKMKCEYCQGAKPIGTWQECFEVTRRCSYGAGTVASTCTAPVELLVVTPTSGGGRLVTVVDVEGPNVQQRKFDIDFCPKCGRYLK